MRCSAWPSAPRNPRPRRVKLVISDAHEGIKAAVARVFRASWQRCRVHFMRNALAHAGRSGRRVVAAFIATAFAQDHADAAKSQWHHRDGLRSVVAGRWSARTGVRLRFIQPGKPIQNAFVESFIGWFRDECLNQHWSGSLPEAAQIIEAWRQHYNCERPHSALGYEPPERFAHRLAALHLARISHRR